MRASEVDASGREMDDTLAGGDVRVCAQTGTTRHVRERGIQEGALDLVCVCVCVARTDSFRQAESTVVEKWPAFLVQLQVELCSRFVRVKKNDVFCRRGGGDAKFASLVFEIPEPRAVP
jgi:hypothetical protein